MNGRDRETHKHRSTERRFQTNDSQRRQTDRPFAAADDDDEIGRKIERNILLDSR